MNNLWVLTKNSGNLLKASFRVWRKANPSMLSSYQFYLLLAYRSVVWKGPKKILKFKFSYKELSSCHDQIAVPKNAQNSRRSSCSSSSSSSLPNLDKSDEFIKTAGINKRPGVPLGLRFLNKTFSLLIRANCQLFI